jgi:hypothetical protein
MGAIKTSETLRTLPKMTLWQSGAAYLLPGFALLLTF